MIAVRVRGVGVWMPGLAGWPAARAVLRGAAPFVPAEAPPPAPALLTANERRRAAASVRLALAVAAEAHADAGVAPGAIPGVFASSNGDATVVGALLETLAGPTPMVSPTQFHNSVHNAAAGYWSIATRSAQPVTSLSGHDGSFAAGLLRAASEVAADAATVLLVAYDLPVPPPLGARRETRFACGVGLVLGPADAAGPMLRVDYRAVPAAADAGLPRLAALREIAAANPAGRALRLLEALARAEADALRLPLFGGQVRVEVTPCSAPRGFAP
ncbi:MAG: beta-ketoacyl synthase chain length factor [Acetobacteraceae bacterium]